jgi:predicted glycosyltransferase
MANQGRNLRFAIYTHDTFGLGHVRRCLHLTRSLAEAEPESAILFITGSPALHAMDALPGNADFLKIPTIVKTGTVDSRPPHLPIPIDETSTLRKRIVYEAVTTFQPDVFLVDNFPLGSRKELLNLLVELRKTGTRTILGLRDIVDMPETVCQHWERDGIYDVLESCYDRILVYGMAQGLDIETAYQLPKSVGEKIEYCGYITGTGHVPAGEGITAAGLGLKSPMILATVGGGGDGVPLLNVFLRALDEVPDVSALVVTGPLMSPADREELRRLARPLQSRVVIQDFVKDMPAYMRAADLVVSMGGYNTVAEIVAQRCPALIIPRNWRYGEFAAGTQAGTEGEQLLRAQLLKRMGLADYLHPDHLDARHLAEKIRTALDGLSTVRDPQWDLNGLPRACGHILNLARETVEGDISVCN